MNGAASRSSSVGQEAPLIPDTSLQDRLIVRPARSVPRRGLMILLVAATLIASATVAGLWRYGGIRNSIDMSRLTLAAVERGEFVRDIAADGQVLAARSPTLYAAAPGTVTLRVRAGDVASKGQTLAAIDSPDLTAKLSQEEATLQNAESEWRRAQLDAESLLRRLLDDFRQAEIDLKTAQRELDRTRKAFDAGAYSELHLLRAQDAAEKAQFAFDRAKAALEAQPEQNRFEVRSKQALFRRQQLVVAELRRQVDALQVRSPVGGRVGQVLIADRANVPKDAALLTVVDLTALEVEIKVPEGFARDLAPGMPATLRGDSREWQAVVGSISPEVVRGEVSARLRFDDSNPAGLRQSQRLSVRIIADRRKDVLMVDRGSFVDQEPGFAYVLNGNVVERRAVRVGAISVHKVEILEGLAVGDRIVISGTDAFDGMDRVMLANGG